MRVTVLCVWAEAPIVPGTRLHTFDLKSTSGTLSNLTPPSAAMAAPVSDGTSLVKPDMAATPTHNGSRSEVAATPTAGPIRGLHLARLPAALVEAAAREVAGIEAEWLQEQLSENVVYHINLPFPIGLPTAPVFRLGSPHVTAVEAVAREALRTFGLDGGDGGRLCGGNGGNGDGGDGGDGCEGRGRDERVRPSAMHAIIRIYSGADGSHIDWHKDKSCFAEAVAGVVLENTLPGGEGLRFRPDMAHAGAEFGLREAPGCCFMFEGEARLLACCPIAPPDCHLLTSYRTTSLLPLDILSHHLTATSSCRTHAGDSLACARRAHCRSHAHCTHPCTLHVRLHCTLHTAHCTPHGIAWHGMVSLRCGPPTGRRAAAGSTASACRATRAPTTDE